VSELASRKRRELNWRRREQRELVDGRLVATKPGLAHGRQGTYVNWSCRCVPCTAANSRAVREWLAR
jgi:hypothetical protein